MTEGQFLYELADRTGVRLLIDVANLHTNHVNRGEDPAEALGDLPLEAIAYVHVAGGFERDGVWHDSHAHPVAQPVLDILTDLASRVAPPGVLLERDENFPAAGELEGEVAAIRTAVEKGRATGAPAVGSRAATPRGPGPPVRRPARGTPYGSGSPSIRPRCCPRWWPGRRCPRGSTGCGWVCRPGRWPRSGRTWSRRSRPSCRRSSARVPDGLPLLRPAAADDRRLPPGRPRLRRVAAAGRTGAGRAVRREVRQWWLEREGPVPRSRRPGVRWARATGRALLRR